jgi:hypothetical protein
MQEQQLKQIIAEAMYAGCLLAEQNYNGEIHSEAHEPLVNSFRKLQKLVGEFGSQNGLNDIDVETIFPLQKEIETLKTLEL